MKLMIFYGKYKCFSETDLTIIALFIARADAAFNE